MSHYVLAERGKGSASYGLCVCVCVCVCVWRWIFGSGCVTVGHLSTCWAAVEAKWAYRCADVWLGRSCPWLFAPTMDVLGISKWRTLTTNPGAHLFIAGVARWIRTPSAHQTPDQRRLPQQKKVQRLLKIAIVSYRRRCAVNRLLYFVVISGCWSINADGEHSYNSVVVVAVICLHWTQKNRYSMSHRPLQQYFPPVALNSDLWLRSTNMTQMGSRWTIVSNI